MSDENEMLTAAEVASMLRVSTRSVYGWARDGDLPVHRCGPFALRFRAEDVRRFGLDRPARRRRRSKPGGRLFPGWTARPATLDVDGGVAPVADAIKAGRAVTALVADLPTSRHWLAVATDGQLDDAGRRTFRSVRLYAVD